MDERIKKIEARLFNIELLLLDLKYSINAPHKGRLIDLSRASQVSGLTIPSLYRTAQKNSIPIYFFENELIECLKHSDLSLLKKGFINKPGLQKEEVSSEL
ncbi:MAG TPA: hypothetical protein VGP43_02460 [Chitinophagaceae bacterium]|nr:hypothetical protein [Chitinophagaceae bacterium]